jgi:hypothetical protein
MIFNEVFPHFAELMTDPFANYLAQRLLEYATSLKIMSRCSGLPSSSFFCR